MSEDLTSALEEYEIMFKDGFPTMAFMGRSEEETLQIVNECLEKEKDVYDLGYLSLDDIQY